MHRHILAALVLSSTALVPLAADAQPLGTFKWQLQSYCNVISVLVTQAGGVYTLDGFDDQCGATTRAPVTGLATPNPNGTIGFGLNIVVTPGGEPVHVAAAISIATLSGTWSDSTGASGTFAFTPGAGTGGSPRPIPSAITIPASIGLFADGQFVAKGALDVGNIPASGPGVRMMWHPAKAAFRVGQVTDSVPTVWDDLNIGVNSTAFGFDTLAAGAWSTAFGAGSAAVGPVSTAMGQNTQALSVYSTAMGNGTVASGISSTAMGSGTQAQAQSSTAMGATTIASGLYSTVAGVSSVSSGLASFAIGNFAEANGSTSFAAGSNVIAGANQTVVLGSAARALVAGAFMFGDASTASAFFALDANSFNVRAAGGYRLYSNSALTTGVVLAGGGSGWGVVSDVNMKENFRDLDAGDVLSKIARMPVREWNYKTQAAAIRHVGPTAQDFHAAFGLGEDSLRINTIDADGIALAGVKALESRTRETNETLTRENEELRGEIAALRERLSRIEQLLAEKR